MSCFKRCACEQFNNEQQHERIFRVLGLALRHVQLEKSEVRGLFITYKRTVRERIQGGEGEESMISGDPESTATEM